MKNYEGRQENLSKKLNSFLTKITGIEKDFYKTLSQEDLFELKTVLSDINNLLTLRLTLTATHWLCTAFNITDEEKAEIMNEIDSVKPNTNGFDIKINNHNHKIVAEVKCVVPSSNGNKYLGAQQNGILDDAIKLKNGRNQISEISDYFKFIFVLNVDCRTNSAINSLLKPSKGKSDNPLRKNRHNIKEHISLLSQDTIEHLSKEKVYLKVLSLEQS